MQGAVKLGGVVSQHSSFLAVPFFKLLQTTASLLPLSAEGTTTHRTSCLLQSSVARTISAAHPSSPFEIPTHEKMATCSRARAGTLQACDLAAVVVQDSIKVVKEADKVVKEADKMMKEADKVVKEAAQSMEHAHKAAEEARGAAEEAHKTAAEARETAREAGTLAGCALSLSAVVVVVIVGWVLLDLTCR
ncbi:unnamed protein product [Zymoseptoria tritici ST99CH_3D7]|uniref:Methyl-accepting transducer domain-containing protein n=1 Tax=Zymoseptoria tritici (strain ST99CH_3D7) TaxID=1276538 RepID=A0A1X7SA03_ZYMT9|nr:unnamed protein product [Zymoseptoria tritici ST99CH_3D7]